MKTFITTCFFCFAALATTLAQTTVTAGDILDKINRKEPITYQNAVITGDLDLTNLANRHEVREGMWRGQGQEFRGTVNVPLTFRDCIFRGKVLAYRAENGKLLNNYNGPVYNADFTEAVTFENCTFDDDAAFKYSVFDQQAIFSKNTFRKEALFKYSKFRAASDFTNVTFKGPADFKYTKFGEDTSFEQARFSRTADFKYTEFEEGVTFRATYFDGPADFKYVNFPRKTVFENVTFDGPSDFKYAKLNGRQFSPGRSESRTSTGAVDSPRR